MTPSRILLVGGSGFIGSHVAARLASQNFQLTIPTRRRERARHVVLLPMADVVETTLATDAELDGLVSGCAAVVNLVGVLHSRWGEPYGPDFAAAHVTLPQRLVDACRRTGVRRLVHVSALGVGDDASTLPSMYLRSKADGERAVRASGLDWTILRPSVVFGADDRFLNVFARLMRLVPVMPVARAQTRFQPVYVGDVAQAIVNALARGETVGKTYELAGPEVFTLGELVRLVGRWSGCERPVWELPYTLGQLQASILEHMPGTPLMSRDNFDSMAIDNVASGPIAPELGITPTALSAYGPHYITPGARYGEERARAHR